MILTDATLADLPLIDAAITDAERALVALRYSHGCLELMRRSVEVSEVCCVIWAGSKPLLIFGVERASLSTSDGHLWMIGTRHIGEHRAGFARTTKRILSGLLERYQTLTNRMDCRDDLAVKWARWCGATVFEDGRFEVKRG